MRRSIWIPAGVCKSQSIAAEASRTINEPHALRELRRLYPAASVLVHAVSDVRATPPRWGVQRSRAFPRASSPKATSRSSQPGPLKHDAVCPERFVPGSSLSCQQHTFMCGTCQEVELCGRMRLDLHWRIPTSSKSSVGQRPHRRSLDGRAFPTLS